MTDAPTSEMASGRKTKVLATDSYLTRSNRAAMSRPSPTAPATPTTSQRMLLMYIWWLAGLVSAHSQLARPAPSVSDLTMVETTGQTR